MSTDKRTTWFMCPYDRTWHDSEQSLLMYCKSNFDIPAEYTYEDLQKRLASVYGSIESYVEENPPREIPEDVKRPFVNGREI